MIDAIGATARWTAAARARESERPDRLFADPLAHSMAGAEGFALLDAEPKESQGNPYLPIRTRFFDDWLERVTEQHSVRQIVFVAAGMDTRTFRLSWPNGTTLWELDRPALLDLKGTTLAAAGAVPTCNRRTLGVDLALDDWPERLQAAGFDPMIPSAWLVEGFFQYLEEAAVERVLAAITTVAAPASLLGADFISRDFLTSEWMVGYLHMLEQRGTPWRFGANEPEALLDRYGWRTEAVTQPGEEGAGFGRWPWPVAPRSVPGIPRSFLITAARAI